MALPHFSNRHAYSTIEPVYLNLFEINFQNHNFTDEELFALEYNVTRLTTEDILHCNIDEKNMELFYNLFSNRDKYFDLIIKRHNKTGDIISITEILQCNFVEITNEFEFDYTSKELYSYKVKIDYKNSKNYFDIKKYIRMKKYQKIL